MENEKITTNEGVNSNQNDLIDTTGKIVVPVIREEIHVEKKVVDKAIVRLSKSVTEKLEEVDVPLIDEEVVIERIPKNEYLDTAPPYVRYEGNVMVISVMKEVAVVEKRMLLVEELRVTKQKNERSEKHEMLLRKEEVNVERTELSGSGSADVR